ncbi:hypothetical protein MVEN_01915500 [Mycena venus]|uniref:Las1-domain-containing protein n=1 Tax=Mycena venus TaxID=2733690 RepID=A0A8H6XEK9_9AGAR|nr:hypothetical protein MVEN_01915500 [Mycena venus]
MRLPRRVPWTSITELDQLCSWIFTDETDLESKTNAINRLSAWRVITPLPHALESTLALLSALIQDASDAKPSSYLSLRHSYSAAIIRLVNGLVDPLQLGAYARSIASIANQLGLPLWLVELRHAATHEDLPSLELLRQAARESMTWLLHNYFLPTINPSTVAPPQSTPLRPLAPFVEAIQVPAQNNRQGRFPEVPISARNQRSFQRYRKVDCRGDGFCQRRGWRTGMGYLRERRPKRKGEVGVGTALRCVNGEGRPSFRFPKKKRVFPADSFLPPKFSVELWSPLLSDLHALHPDFPAILSNRIVSYLLTEPPQLDMVPIAVDTTYDACLARWVMWTIDSWDAENSESDLDLKRDTIISLITGLGPSSSLSRDTAAAMALIQALCAGNPEMDAAMSILLRPQTGSMVREWTSDDISVMTERLATLLAVPESSAEVRPSQPDTVSVEMSDATLGPGWRLLDANSNWKPSPHRSVC